MKEKDTRIVVIKEGRRKELTNNNRPSGS